MRWNSSMVTWLSPMISYINDNDLINKAFNEFVKFANKTFEFNSDIIVFECSDGVNKNSNYFKHFITGRVNGLDIFEPERAKRVPWIENVLNNYKDIKEVYIYEEEYTFKEEYRNYTRIMFLVPKAAYMLVVEKNIRGYFVITAYHLDNQNRVGSYMSKYKTYKKQKSALGASRSPSTT